MPPGRCVVLLSDCLQALWVNSWPFAQYVKHAWAGAWTCSLFRNEGVAGLLSSDLIGQAISATRSAWGDPPPLGMITFVNAEKVRAKADPGYCFLRAGFVSVGQTKGGLMALQLLPADMPAPVEPLRAQPHG